MIHYTIAKILVIIGALNWGLVGVSNLLKRPINIVEYLFFELANMPNVADTIYILVGAAAIVMIIAEIANRQ